MKSTALKQKRIKTPHRIKQASLPPRSKARRNGDSAKLLIGVKNILVPTDFSERSLDGLAYAENIAELTGAKLCLISVVQPLVLPVPLTSLAMDNDRLIKA